MLSVLTSQVLANLPPEILLYSPLTMCLAMLLENLKD